MELRFELNKPAFVVYDHLSDMQKFVTVHPIIYKIESIGGNEYLVYERLKLLFVPARFTYKVILDADSTNKTVSYKARINAITSIEMHFRIDESEKGCKVSEVVSFNTFLPVKTILRSIFRTQHHQLFKNINNL
jgi:carbon monoxide dehydrogenase subunit G